MRRGTLLVTTIAFAAACASAGKNSGDDQPTIDAKGSHNSDAAVVIDGPNIDAAPVMVTLSQTTGATVGATSSIACHRGARLSDVEPRDHRQRDEVIPMRA